MKKWTVYFIFATLSSISQLRAEQLDPKFFANAAFQRQFSGAFALQEESLDFVNQSLHKTFSEGDALIASIRNNPVLFQSVLDFPKLEPVQKLSVLRHVFKLEVAASGLLAPELVFDDSAKRSTFFEFDPKIQNAGRVILNPTKLFANSNPYDALLFLIHETRHSYQFQLTFNLGGEKPTTISEAFDRGFAAQKQLFDQGIRPSFCDFLTLNQEYEAFLFGNYVVETLTNGSVDTSKMGTLASQHEPGHGLKINLSELAQKVGSANLLDAFNELEKAQWPDRVKSDSRLYKHLPPSPIETTSNFPILDKARLSDLKTEVIHDQSQPDVSRANTHQ